MAVPQLSFLRSCVCCKDLGSNGLNNKHSLEEQVLHLAFTTSTLAPVRWIKPVWLPRKAKVPLQGGWYRTETVCHWPWNVKSTIRKAELPQHKLGSPWKNWCNFPASLFCNAQALLKTILNHGSWRLSHSCDSCAVGFAAKIWARIASTAWKNNCCTLPVQLQHSHPSDGSNQCGSQEKQKYHCMVAGVPREEYAFGQMSNQQWEKPDLPQLKPGSLAKTVGYLQLRSFTFVHTISI